MKVCFKCKTEKGKKEFTSSPKRPDGLYAYCKKCTREYKTNRRIEMKKKLNKYKKTLRCKICGFSDWRALTFHHKNPDQKTGDVSDIIRSSWKAAKKEIEKCDVLCSNCHAIEHYERK